MNFEKYIEDYYENYAKNAEGQIKGTVKNFVETAIQDFLVQEGYGRENAKNFVEVITGNNQKIDYSHILDINEDSKLFAKVADLKIFESISKLQDFNNLLNESLDTYQLCLELDKQMQENGKCEPEDLKNLLSVILDSAINAANAMPGSNIFALSAYQTTKEYIMNYADFIIDAAAQLDVNNFISGNTYALMQSDQYAKWCELSNGIWENGPSVAELEAIYEMYSNAKLLDSYLEWRIAYEFRIELEKQFEADNIDMTVEEYFEMMNKLTDDRPWWEKALNKIGIDIDFEKDKDEDVITAEIDPTETFGKYIENTSEIDTKKVINKLVAEAKDSATKASTTKVDPIIFDLDGDGFNIETKEDGTYFDLDKNEFAERINWTKKDGFLCLDLNENGNIDSGGELFGDNTLLADGTEAANGFEALAQYDSNSDGVIDANDEIFGSLRVWVDSDGSGTSEAGELKTLADLGIVSINLGYETVNGETGTEATIGNASTFTYADGTIGNIGELWVSSDLYDTVDDLDIEIPDDIKALPNVGSIGNVYSLHNAMVLDETGELKALVESFAAEQDADKRMELAEQILFFITGADDVADGSRGKYMDAKQLSVIEALLGENYVGRNGKNPNSAAAPLLKEAYNDLLNMYYNELMAQSHIKDYVQLLRYTENEDGTKTLNDDLLNYVLEYQLANGDENAKGILADIARYVMYLEDGGITGMAAFLANYAAISTEYVTIIGGLIDNSAFADGSNPFEGSSSADYIFGTDGENTIYGKNGNDTLIGGKGDDYLNGAAGNDTYIFNIGDGNDVIEDHYANSSYSRKDKIVFGDGISSENLIVERSGDDLVLKYGDGDSVTVLDHFGSAYSNLEYIEFADGTLWGLDEIMDKAKDIYGTSEDDVLNGFNEGSSYNTNEVFNAGDGNDKIYGKNGSDTLIGGKGDDYLNGAAGNDTYIFNIGDGNDVIEDYYANSSYSRNDKIIFGEGISIDDIIFTKSGNDLLISFTETEDSITITNHNSSSYNRVENFTTSDGYIIDYSKVNQLIQAMASFEADTGMNWADAVEQGNEIANNIVSEMWVKSVS